MKYLTVAAIVASLAITATAIAQTTAPAAAPATKAACETAKMKWDDKGGKDAKGACMAAMTTPAPAAKPADVKK